MVKLFGPNQKGVTMNKLSLVVFTIALTACTSLGDPCGKDGKGDVIRVCVQDPKDPDKWICEWDCEESDGTRTPLSTPEVQYNRVKTK